MTGSYGPRRTSQLCKVCADEPGRTVVWTPEAIIERFQTFHRETGRAPSAVDVMWRSPSISAKMTAERIAEAAAADYIRLPNPSVVRERFGSWNAALAAAGMTANPVGIAARRTPYPNLEKEARDQLLTTLRLRPISTEEIDTHSPTGKALQRLARDGVATRERDPDDRRRVIYRLSEGRT